MAAALFNKKMEQMGLSDRCQAQSAGTWGRDGYPAAEEAIQMMQAHGLDISAHRSREVNAEIVNTADLILTMERGHKEAMQIEFSHNPTKILMFSEIIGQGYDIADPYGMGLQEFEETAAELEAIIEKGMDEILRRASTEFFEE